jgi:hypothetical protein
VKGNRSDTDDNARHFLHLTQTQQGIANTPKQTNKEDKKEEDVEMKTTAEKDPLETTDPWKEAIEPSKLQKHRMKKRVTQKKTKYR